MTTIHYLLGTELVMAPFLAQTMFFDRATQFHDRLGWQVQVDQQHRERDQYDNMNPLYVIVSAPNGAHLGSLRLLPTTGPTMANEYFLDCLGGHPISHPATWECSRFCIAAGADQLTSVRLLAATGRVMQELGISELIAIFDNRMIGAYRRLGASPSLLGQMMDNGALIHGGLWSFDSHTLRKLLDRACLDPMELELSLAVSSLTKKVTKI